jgi:transposase
MQPITSATVVATTARANDTTLFASLELSKSKWVVTINGPGSERFSKHVVEGGDGASLLDLLSRSRAKAEQRDGVQVKAIVIQEAGLDGFWIHRLLIANGIESHVVDAASIAVDRRHWQAKTDAIDGETLLRTLMAWARGERRVCSMVRAPSPEDEDRRLPKRWIVERTFAWLGRCRRLAFSIPIGSGACSAAKASGITIRFGAIVSNDWRRCEPATAVSCRRC